MFRNGFQYYFPLILAFGDFSWSFDNFCCICCSFGYLQPVDIWNPLKWNPLRFHFSDSSLEQLCHTVSVADLQKIYGQILLRIILLHLEMLREPERCSRLMDFWNRQKTIFMNLNIQMTSKLQRQPRNLFESIRF